jgi:P27 family predicted phage terminase small subunit
MRGARPELRIVDEGYDSEPSANLPKVADRAHVHASENPPIGGIKDSGSESLSIDQAANLPLETVPGENSFGASKPPIGGLNCGNSAVEQDANLRVQTSAEHEPVSPPAVLPAEAAAEWRRIVADLRERRLWKDSMAGLVTSYVLAQATALRLEIQIAAEGASVTGAGGAPKPHPCTGLLRSSRETVARLGAELGLTPTARSRKSLQPARGQGSLFEDKWDL